MFFIPYKNNQQCANHKWVCVNLFYIRLLVFSKHVNWVLEVYFRNPLASTKKEVFSTSEIIVIYSCHERTFLWVGGCVSGYSTPLWNDKETVLGVVVAYKMSDPE